MQSCAKMKNKLTVGNSRTAVLCCVSPGGASRSETRSTLDFAKNASKVVNHVSVNRIVTVDAQMHQYRMEIGALKRKLRRSNTGDLHASLERAAEELRSQRQLTAALKSHLEAHVGKIPLDSEASDSPAKTRRALQLIKSTVEAFKTQSPRSPLSNAGSAPPSARWRTARSARQLQRRRARARITPRTDTHPRPPRQPRRRRGGCASALGAAAASPGCGWTRGAEYSRARSPRSPCDSAQRRLAA
jgi:hypothetical protein